MLESFEAFWPLFEQVEIVWKDSNPDTTWRYYILINVKDGWAKLQGIDSPDGCQYNGGPFFVSLDLIDTITPLMVNKYE
jgi:hypothetical protein